MRESCLLLIVHQCFISVFQTLINCIKIQVRNEIWQNKMKKKPNIL